MFWWRDTLLVCKFQMWGHRYKQWDSRWFQGRKMRFCRIWSTIQDIFSSTNFYNDYFTRLLLHTVYWTDSCHCLWTTVDSLWDWHESGKALDWCQLYFVLRIDFFFLVKKIFVWNKIILNYKTIHILLMNVHLYFRGKVSSNRNASRDESGNPGINLSKPGMNLSKPRKKHNNYVIICDSQALINFWSYYTESPPWFAPHSDWTFVGGWASTDGW